MFNGNTIILQDDNKNEIKFEFLDLISYRQKEYVVLLPVDSFDDQVVMIETELGLLTVKGEELRINKLSIDTSEVIVEGNISHLSYSEKNQEKSKGSLIGKIFK